LCGKKWQFEIVLCFILFEVALKSEIRISKHETNSNDINLNDINGKRPYHTAFVLNFEHLDFDIVSANLIKWADFDILIFTTVDAFRQHVKLPKSCTGLLIHYTICQLGPGKLELIPGFNPPGQMELKNRDLLQFGWYKLARRSDKFHGSNMLHVCDLKNLLVYRNQLFWR